MTGIDILNLLMEITAISAILIVVLNTLHDYGFNKYNITDLTTNRLRIPTMTWHTAFKDYLNKLGKKDFSSFKMKGVPEPPRSRFKASRGYDKLKDLLRQSKELPHGVVLSLCAGRGGWEQVVAPLPAVKKIYSFTLGSGPGHQGHEDFTKVGFEGKHKIKLTYGNVMTIPNIPHDTLLFDGGESYPQADKEVDNFARLFQGSVMRQINKNTKTFILKVLTPSDKRIIQYLKDIQHITGRGCFYRCLFSRNSTMELYFISGPICNIEASLRSIITKMFMEKENAPVEQPDHYFDTPEIGKHIVKPDYTESIKELGPPMAEAPFIFKHWVNHGLYNFGIQGSTHNNRVDIAMSVLAKASTTLHGFDSWRTTGTTPEKFLSVFNAKIDTPPLEKHEYAERLQKVYYGMASAFKRKGFRYRELDWSEVRDQANKQGASTYQDNANSVGEFLKQRTGLSMWKKYAMTC